MRGRRVGTASEIGTGGARPSPQEAPEAESKKAASGDDAAHRRVEVLEVRRRPLV